MAEAIPVIPVVCSRAYQCVGLVEETFVTPRMEEWWPNGRSLFATELLLVFAWSKEYERYLDLRVNLRNRDYIAQNPEEVADALTAHRIPFQYDILLRNKYTALRVSGEDRLSVRFLVDTDAPRLWELADQRLRGQRLQQESKFLEHEIRIYLWKTDGNHELKRLQLRIGPLVYPELYNGVIAIDLGNTNTCVATLRSDRGPTSRFVDLLPDADYEMPLAGTPMGPQETPFLSALRIDAVIDINSRPAQEYARQIGIQSKDLLGRPDGYWWRIGKWVRPSAEGPGGLLLSPKRSVARRNSGQALRIETGLGHGIPPRCNRNTPRNHVISLPSTTFPAALFLSRLLQIFRAIARAYPTRLVTTYPTTYSSSELALLKKTVAQAWFMAEQRNPNRRPSEEELIPLLIDEATAAAFFYLARKFLEQPGGLRTFRWLYPEGFHLLVYDCGGATVDIALVRIEAFQDARLRFTVLGRTGIRDFGSDEISVAIFVLLKAKLAALLAQQLSERLPAMPAIRSDSSDAWALEFRNYWEQYERHLDEWVPTDFPPGGGGADHNARQWLTLALWEWAEEIKKQLAKNEPIGNLRACHEDVFQCLQRVPSTRARPIPDQLLDQLRHLPITRAEVDALIQPHVNRSVSCCATLLHSKLPDREGHVEDIFLIGNGSLYPLIREKLSESILGVRRDDIALSLLDEGQTFRISDLKTAVAKGAALALAMTQGALGITLEFDSELSRRLPYSIAWFDAATNASVTLYAEGTKYEDLSPKEFTISSHSHGQALRTLRLMHCWPGGKYENFLLFNFSQDIVGKVILEYDLQSEQFVAYSEQTGERVVGYREIDPGVYQSPPQRGKIRLANIH